MEGTAVVWGLSRATSGVFLHIRKQTWLCLFLVPVCSGLFYWLWGMLMGTEWSQSQASLRTPWRFWKTQFCPGSILSKQIFSLSVPALRISYATESFLEQSSGMHWYGTACQHPDARTVSCWPVLKSKWGEKKKSISDNGTVMLDSLTWSIFFIYLC